LNKHNPASFTTRKHMASDILRLSKGKGNMRSKHHEAAWDEDFLFNMITT